MELPMMDADRMNGRYSGIAQLLHWGIVALLIWQYSLALRAWRLPVGEVKVALLNTHRSVGITLLVLMIARLLWRRASPPPKLPPSIKPAGRWLALANHRLLYAIVVVLPLSGWLLSNAAGVTVSYFGAFDLPGIVRADAGMLHQMKLTHLLLNTLLMCFVALHLLAVLRHQFLLKDRVLARMLPF
jgi:cytochrome b561